MDRDDNVPPLGEQQSASPILRYVEDFKPLVPTEEMKTTSQRLQHIFVTNGSPASFAHVVSKQWRADRINGRSTWAVVGTQLEVGLLGHDLRDGDATDVPGQTIDSEFITVPWYDEPLSDSGLVILTFERLVTVLTECWQGDGTWQWDATFGSPTVVMNFAWGNMSFEMAFACPLLARLIEDTIQTSSQVVMACTVSSDNRSYFGKEWGQVKMQEITSPRRGPRQMLIFRGSGAWEADNRRKSFQEIDKLLFDISDVGGRPQGQRTLLVADHTTTNMLPEVSRPLPANRMYQLRAGNTVNIAVDSKLAYLGQVSSVSDVVIFPYMTGCINDMGQTVCGADECGMERSQAEINYYSRCNQESDIQPRIHLLASEDYFRHLPAHCETSAAHSLHLARLLVCCKLIWPDVPLAEVPVLLPADDRDVTRQLQHLLTKGIMVRSHGVLGEVNSFRAIIRPELYSMMKLTKLGHMTATILMKGVQSFSSAHLLAQLLEPASEDIALDHDNDAIVEAVLALSVLTELNKNGGTRLNRATFMRRNQPGHKPWYEENMKGIAEGQAGRGPIWLAAGLWQMLQNHYGLRGPLEFCEARPLPAAEIKLNGDRISVNLLSTLRWDRRLETFSAIFSSLSGKCQFPPLSEVHLTPTDLLAVEVALVRAFMDRIMVVVDQGREFEAWDLATSHKIDRPFDSQEAQIWWEDCHERDLLPSGDISRVIFCIYSYLAYSPSADGRSLTRKPVDATFVSAKAVLLAFKGANNYSAVQNLTRNARSR